MHKTTRKAVAAQRRRKRRYIPHERRFDPHTKVYLVYYYSTENVILTTDGPFEDEPSALKKMKEFLCKGWCAWMVSYND
jgi:hypothetical protein